MNTITLTLPGDKYTRLKALAASKNMSLNKLFDEFSTTVLSEYDAEMRFKARSAKASKRKGLKILDELDRHFQELKRDSIADRVNQTRQNYQKGLVKTGSLKDLFEDLEND
ncbi:hypothetical protein GMMP15_660003 [Candidatus Magnetomoraceae bacterium gMMP-15]